MQITPPNKYRRYYLHRKVKDSCKLRSRLHIIEIPYGQWDELNSKTKKYMSALRDQYGYSIQTQIPQ